MLSAPSAVRIFAYALPTDMRKSFDGLHAIVTNEFTMDVLNGDYFVFFNRALDRCKILMWDRDGLVVWAKRLERGRFQRPLDAANGLSIEIVDVVFFFSCARHYVQTVVMRSRFRESLIKS
jgi:transposase